MTNRYSNRNLYDNTKKIYKKQLDSRKLKHITHYGTPDLKDLTIEDISTLEIINITWKTGDKLYKLAERYYNDPKLWWVIAQFNQKPTDSHYSLGDVVYIPLPLEKVLTLYGV